MQKNSSGVHGSSRPDALDSALLARLNTTNTIEISGRQYITPDNLATTLGVTVRTLCRWDAARIGPRKIKIGKLILFDLAKLPDWLSTRETEPVRAARSLPVGRNNR